MVLVIAFLFLLLLLGCIDDYVFLGFLHLIHEEPERGLELLYKNANLLQHFYICLHCLVPLLNDHLGLKNWVFLIRHAIRAIWAILALCIVEVTLSKSKIFVGLHYISLEFFFPE